LMSVQVCVAIALLRGDVDISDLDASADPDVRSLASRVSVVHDESVPSHGARVLVHTANNVLDAGEARGLIADEARARQVYARLRPATGLSPVRFAELLALLDGLPEHGDIHDLFNGVATTH